MYYKTKIGIAVICIITALSLLSCESGINGSGENQTISPSIGEFSSINISIPADVYIDTQSEIPFSISAQENILKNTDIYVKDGTLIVKFDDKVNDHSQIVITMNKDGLKDIDFSGEGSIEIASNYNTTDMDIDISGDCDVVIKDTLWCNNFEYNISGAATLTAEAIISLDEFEADISGSERMNISYLSCNEFSYEVSGTGYTNITGICNTQEIDASGYIEHLGLDFQSKTTDVEISGSSDLELYVTDYLKTDISGSATITLKGDAILELDNSGLVEIIREN